MKPKFNLNDKIIVKWKTYDGEYEIEHGVVVGYFIGKHDHLYYKIKTKEGIKEAPHYQIEESLYNITPQDYLKK